MTHSTLSTALAAAAIATAHGAARAQVFIDCTANATARFLRVEELTHAAPFGREGLRFQAPSWGFNSITGSPQDSYAGSTLWTSEPRGGYDGFLPGAGDGWDLSQSVSLARSEEGYAANVSQLVLDMSFVNQTGGASAYAIDLIIDWDLTYRVRRPTGLFDTAVLFASADGSVATGAEIAPLPGVTITTDTDTPETTLRGTNLIHLVIGATPENPGAGFARVNLTFTAQGYVSTIPGEGPAAVLGVGLGLLGVRRMRRR